MKKAKLESIQNKNNTSHNDSRCYLVIPLILFIIGFDLLDWYCLWLWLLFLIFYNNFDVFSFSYFNACPPPHTHTQFSFLCVLVRFLSKWHKLESLGKRTLKWESALISFPIGKSLGRFHGPHGIRKQAEEALEDNPIREPTPPSLCIRQCPEFTVWWWTAEFKINKPFSPKLLFGHDLPHSNRNSQESAFGM